MKEFVEKLKKHLYDTDWRWKERRTYGGCETCGYGGSEEEAIDGELLWEEIDKFCESFKDKE